MTPEDYIKVILWTIATVVIVGIGLSHEAGLLPPIIVDLFRWIP